MNLKEFLLVPIRLQNGNPLRKVTWSEVIEEPWSMTAEIYYGFFHEWINKISNCANFELHLITGIVEDMEGKLFLINLRNMQFINDTTPININTDNVP